MGLRFDKIDAADEIILSEWLMQVSSEELGDRKREDRQILSSRKQKIVLVICIVTPAAAIALALAWLGLLR